MSAARITLGIAAAALALGACGGRPSYWDTPVDANAASYGLARGVALVDDGAHRIVLASPEADQGLSTRSFPVGHHVTSATTSPDGARLFVLSAGDTPRRTQSDEYPSLTVLDTSGAAPVVTRYPMAEPLSSLAVDPLGSWVVAYAGAGTSTSFVANPNEIVVFDLASPPGPSNPVARTLRSFGGQPRRLTFTKTLGLPAGPRRLLLVETDVDVTLLDLNHAFDPVPRAEITVRLTNGADARQVSPAALVVDDGDPKRSDDARIALRTNDANVITLQLTPSAAGAPNDFTPAVNLTDVGGVPSDIAFVRTDGGLRVAALVPSTSSAVLVEPDTSITTQVALPSAYARLSLVTDVVGDGADASGDVALLWSGNGGASGVAFWALGKTVGQPYRSLEVVGVGSSIADVHDVPSPNARLKVLEMGSRSGFFVLDLLTRTAAPLGTTSAPTVTIAPDGKRMWAYAAGSTQLASVDLATLHPVPLVTGAPIAAAYDVGRADGGRSLVVLHAEGTLAATVFDALAPDTATSRLHTALLLGGP